MLDRLKIYFKEMFPVSSFFSGALISISSLLMISLLSGEPFKVSYVIICASVSMMFFLLLLRIMDEFKDYPDDLINYPNRPLPSGRVKLSDLKFLYYINILILIFLNIFFPTLWIPSIVVFIYSLLMLKWFFIEEKMRKSLPLALISHHPIVFLYFYYIFEASQGVNHYLEWKSLIYLTPLALTFTNWELSRKIRRPQDEDNYVTYSQLLGHKGAIYACLFVQLLIFLGLEYFFYKINLSLWYMLSVLGIFLILTLPYLKFLNGYKIAKNADLKRPLRAAAENIFIVTQLLIIVTYFVF